MTKVRRNAPCPCGSGQKAKRCCDANRSDFNHGIIPIQLYAEALDHLDGITKIEMYALVDQLPFLPELDLSLQVPLPVLSTPELERAIDALQDDDVDAFDQALVQIVPLLDTHHARRSLANAVISCRDDGIIERQIAALAIIELGREPSTLFISAVAESIAVLAGDRHTPSGLLIA
jgi:hypothetical protein